MCFFPVTMTSLLTCSDGMDMSKSLLAKADVISTCSTDSDADSVAVLRRFVAQAAIVGVGTWALRNRFLCTLSLIFCSNEHGMHVGFGGNVGRGLETGQGINSSGGRGWVCNQRAMGLKDKPVAHQICSQVLFVIFLLLVRPL